MNAPVGFHVGTRGFGTALSAPPTVSEALTQAGLNWTVSQEKIFTEHNGQTLKAPGSAVVRTDTQQVLGVVGERYHAVQNHDAFGFFEPFLQDGSVTMESGGTVSGGQRLWMLGRINVDPVDIVRDDPVFSYVLLSNSHDGSLALRLGFTNVRVVCCNMLTAAKAFSEKKSKLLRIRHTASASEALKMAGTAMDLAKRDFEATVEQYKAMASRGVRTGDLERYVKRVFKPELIEGSNTWEDVHDDFHANTVKNLVTKIEVLMEDETNTLPGVKGTVWSMYNAVTHYLTHERGRSEDSRINSLFFGDSATANSRALLEGFRLAAA